MNKFTKIACRKIRRQNKVPAFNKIEFHAVARHPYRLSSLKQISLTNELTRLKSQIPSLIKRKELGKIPSIQKKIMDINRHLYELSQREYGSKY